MRCATGSGRGTYDYAYRVRSVWRVREPVGLAAMRDEHGITVDGVRPRGLGYVPDLLTKAVVWDQQERMWSESARITDTDDGSH
ncbi:hypothetical protein C8R44DRAFT_918636 [Mycena epipterygia]|nr:hypothetical protein C8R44DRAFT_918636 [Mycena epipterygia]